MLLLLVVYITIAFTVAFVFALYIAFAVAFDFALVLYSPILQRQRLDSQSDLRQYKVERANLWRYLL